MTTRIAEPWRTDESEHDCPNQDIVIIDADGRKIARVPMDDAPVEDYNRRQRAAARRIVACVNACEGISTENLVDNVPLKQGLTGLNQRIRDVEQQRDELLAALESCESLLSTIPSLGGLMGLAVVENAREAIAKVKGGAV